MIGVVSDLHSNIEALEAIRAHMRRQGVSRVFCLGDVIGYGPDPVACLQYAMTEFEFTLMGNHEWAILNEALGFNPVARGAVTWHKRALDPALGTGTDRKRIWEWLSNLPLRKQHGQFHFVHASPSNPTDEYLLRSDVDEVMRRLSPKLTRAFKQVEWITMVGHTHFPGIITDDAEYMTPDDLDHVFEPKKNQRYFVNVGSVGQPRDNDNRSCYITLERGRIRWHRVEYDVERTYQKVLGSGGLDKSLGERLRIGV